MIFDIVCGILCFVSNFFYLIFMRLICPECKNDVDLTAYPNLSVDNVVECDSCGITLQVNDLDDGDIAVEVVDEGK